MSRKSILRAGPRRLGLVTATLVAVLAGGYGLQAWQDAPVRKTAADGPAAAGVTRALATGALTAFVVRPERTPVPDVAFQDAAGQPLSLSQWRGRVVLVNLWATWCAPCREEIPILVGLQEKYGARGLQFVGIAIDQRDKVQAFAREFKINYVVLLGGLETIDVSRQIGNRLGALPFTVVLDRGGRIVSRELGKVKEAQLERLVASLL